MINEKCQFVLRLSVCLPKPQHTKLPPLLMMHHHPLPSLIAAPNRTLRYLGLQRTPKDRNDRPNSLDKI